MAITIKIEDAGVQSFLRRLERVATDLRRPLGEIGHTLAENARLRFRVSRGPDGTRWQRLSPVTIARRRKGSAVPLLDTGKLRNEITFRPDARSVTVGTNVIYAAVQQLGARKGAFGRTSRGAPIPWGTIPPRPFLGVSTEDREEIIDILRSAITREVR